MIRSFIRATQRKIPFLDACLATDKIEICYFFSAIYLHKTVYFGILTLTTPLLLLLLSSSLHEIIPLSFSSFFFLILGSLFFCFLISLNFQNFQFDHISISISICTYTTELTNELLRNI